MFNQSLEATVDRLNPTAFELNVIYRSTTPRRAVLGYHPLSHLTFEANYNDDGQLEIRLKGIGSSQQEWLYGAESVQFLKQTIPSQCQEVLDYLRPQ